MERTNQMTVKEYFDNIPKVMYPAIKRDIFTKMKMTNQTYYNWVNGKTKPNARDREALIAIIESNLKNSSTLFSQL